MSTSEWLLETEVGWGVPHPTLALLALAVLALGVDLSGLAAAIAGIRGRGRRNG